LKVIAARRASTGSDQSRSALARREVSANCNQAGQEGTEQRDHGQAGHKETDWNQDEHKEAADDGPWHEHGHHRDRRDSDQPHHQDGARQGASRLAVALS
jgi:hypothetical protein